MLIHELFSKGHIHVADDITFKNHTEVMSLFGSPKFNLRAPTCTHPFEDDTIIWFPKFGDSDPKWRNSRDKHWGRIFEKRLQESDAYVEDLLSKPVAVRLLFENPETGRTAIYRFRGVYKFNPELSQNNAKAIYDRISETAKVYPLH
jgi:hypothetical protein